MKISSFFKKEFLNFTLMKSTIILLCFMSFILLNCKRDNCAIVEMYPNGDAKSIACVVDERSKYFCYKNYFDNGSLESTFCLVDGIIDGKRIDYYRSGLEKSIFEYEKGLRHGLCVDFREDGKKDFFNYYYNDVPIYGEFYRYDTLGVSYDYVFNPIIEIFRDTVGLDSAIISFEVRLPIPDSIRPDYTPTFMYDLKPLSLKDSTLYSPSYKTTISYDEPFMGKLSVDKPGKHVFYGYIGEVEADGKIHAFNPYEKIITVLSE